MAIPIKSLREYTRGVAPDRKVVPDALQDYDQWVVWKQRAKDNRKQKAPCDPQTGNNIDYTEPSTWSSYRVAHQSVVNQDEIDGLGFVFTEDDPFVGIDWDDIVHPDEGLPEYISTWLKEIDSYSELSPSGTGLHTICLGEHQGAHRADLPDGVTGHLEVYDSDRYFTVTGTPVTDDFREVTDGGEALQALQSELLSESNEATRGRHTRSSSNKDAGGPSTKEIKRTIEEYAKSKKVSGSATDALRLWTSTSNTSFDYASPSEADLALCSHLAFWCREDQQLIKRCLYASNRTRNKWNEDRGDETWLDGRINKAIRDNQDTFSGHYVSINE